MDREYGQLQTAEDANLVEDPGKVVFDCVLADSVGQRDVAVTLPIHDGAHDFQLTRGKPVLCDADRRSTRLDLGGMV